MAVTRAAMVLLLAGSAAAKTRGVDMSPSDAVKKTWSKANEMGWAVEHGAKWQFKSTAQAASVCDYPTPGDTVEVFYTGRLRKSGGVFDSNRDGKAYKLTIGSNPMRVIRGWDWGLREFCWKRGEKVGESGKLYLDAEYAYGSAGSNGGQQSIPKNADLVFEIEIMSLVKGEAPAGSVTTPASDGKPQKIMGSKSDKKAPRKGSPAAFFDAVLAEDLPLMESLLEEYPEYLNIKDDLGTSRSALMDAAVNGKDQAVEWLIEKGADVTIGENAGYTPLDAAAYRGSGKIIKMLLEAGLDPHLRQRDGYVPMHRACFSRGNKATAASVVKAFYEFGFDINTLALEENDDGPIDNDFPLGTCRDMAVSRGQQHVLDYLDSLGKGADGELIAKAGSGIDRTPETGKDSSDYKGNKDEL